MQIKSRMRHHNTPLRMAEKIHMIIPNADEDARNWITDTLLIRTGNGTASLENRLAVSVYAIIKLFFITSIASAYKSFHS